MNNEEDILEEYFDPSTSHERREEIKKVFLSDKNEDANILLDLKASLDLTPDLQEFRERLVKIERKKRRFHPYKVVASIAFLFFISTVIFYLAKIDHPSPQEAFETYFVPYDGYTIVRSSDERPAIKGLASYEAGNYEEALETFLSVYDKTQVNAELNLLISTCYLKLDDATRALVYLKEIDDFQGSMIKHNRDWYLALSYLFVDISNSKHLLHEISQSNSPYSFKAKNLLKEDFFAKPDVIK